MFIRLLLGESSSSSHFSVFICHPIIWALNVIVSFKVVFRLHPSLALQPLSLTHPSSHPRSARMVLTCSGATINCQYACARPPPPCGHPKTAHPCHESESCPPCPYLTTRACACGKDPAVKHVRCSQDRVSCGQICGTLLPCGFHTCDKSCHKPGECEPCAQTCNKPKRICRHPCTAQCHAPTR